MESKRDAILEWCHSKGRAPRSFSCLQGWDGGMFEDWNAKPVVELLGISLPGYFVKQSNKLVQQSNSGLILLSSGCWVNAAVISFYLCFLSSLLLWSTICPFVWCVQKSNSVSISLLRSPGRHSWAIVQCCSWPCWCGWTMCWMFNGNWVMGEWLDQIKVK